MRGNKEKAIILPIDGGICSQIDFYALGYTLEEKGYLVKYDLTWFHTCSKDMTGKFARNFDFQRAFPRLKIIEATPKEIQSYKKKYQCLKDDLNAFVPPCYPVGYSKYRVLSFLKYRSTFIKEFQPKDKDDIKDILKEIKQKNSCAVHVRRGDLAQYTQAYGHPCSTSYFLKAIKIIQKLEKNVHFYFFSDEPEWIKKEIIPHLDKNTKYTLWDKNGSDKGYLDLYLISKCRHIIASKGSLGTTAKILNNEKGYFVAPCNKVFMADYFENCLFISDETNEALKADPLNYSNVAVSPVMRFLIQICPLKFLRKKLRKKYHVL